MKLTIEQAPHIQESEVHIRCAAVDRQIQQIIEIAGNELKTLPVRQDGTVRVLRPQQVYYIESVDEKCFVYGKKDVYSSDMKLYEMEERLKNTSFVRISKSCLLNIDWLDSVKVLMNGKMEALLQNGERLIINRHYVPAFKQKFGL